MFGLKAYVFRIYPNKAQRHLIVKTIGCSRFVFNYFLDKWNDLYKETNKGLSYYSCSKELPILKNELEWLKEVDSIALQSSLHDLSDAFSRYIKKQNKHPIFKSKSNNNQSYTTKFTNDNIKIIGNKIKLPKLGLIKFKQSQTLNGRIINATIRVTTSGKYYVSILVQGQINHLPKTSVSVGIDLGISDFAILSDGSKYDNNYFTKTMLKRIKREQRKLSRMFNNNVKGYSKDNKPIFIKPLSDCKNYQKQKKKLARLYEKVSNQRKDYLNKLSTNIIKNHDIICIEDLNIKGMMKNHKLSQAIADVSWSKFVRKLEYKARWYGKKIVKVSAWFPSTKTCSCCNQKTGPTKLNTREWVCANCHTHHDRDINASINILNEGLKTLNS